MKVNTSIISPRQVASKALQTMEAALESIARQARTQVIQLREAHPTWRDDDLVARLETRYLALVSASGAAAGSASAAPGVGTMAGLGASGTDLAVFCRATATYALAVAHVHGRDELLNDPELRTVFVKLVLLGGQGAQLVSQVAGRVGAHWGRQLTQRIPVATLHRVNGVLGQHLITKYGTTRGVLVLGKALPFGFGAAIGGAGNAGLGWCSVRTVRSALGPVGGELPVAVAA